MKQYDFSPDRFFGELYENRVSPYENIKAEDIPSVSADIKNRLKEILSIEKIPHKNDELTLVELSSEKRKGYEIKAYSVEICKNLNLLCYILYPEKSNGFGVVSVCGHGYGVRQIIRQSKNGKYRKINFFDNYQKNFALELVKRGNTVIAFEPVAFGKARLRKDRRKPFYISSCETVSMHSLMYGFSTASLRIYQAQRCIDILQMQGLEKIGIMGISGGGLISLYTSLVDDRIEKTVVSGYVNTFGKSVLSMWHCTDNYIPGILEIGDMYDFAASLAPKELLLECGEKDRLFPVDASREAVKRIKAVYEKLGANESFTVDFHKGKHQISGDLSFDFFGEKVN